jgi:subtilisin-like proprotein convertase family protein
MEDNNMYTAGKQSLVIVLVLLSFALAVQANAQQFVQVGDKLVGTGAIGAQQGRGVAVSADGNTAIVGGFTDNGGIGAAWVYVRAGDTWTQQGEKLVGTGAVGSAWQGFAVALSADGNTAIVGGYRDNSFAGAAWVYTRNGTAWTQQGPKLVGTGAVGGAFQGSAVSLSADGNTAIVGGLSDNLSVGAAWVFTRSDTVWTQQGAKLVGTGAVGGSNQGGSVSLSADGNTAIVGGYGDNNFAGAVWIYTRSDTVWTQQGLKHVGTGAIGNASQGRSVSLSADGNTAVVGGNTDNVDAGATWVFTRDDTVWTQDGPKLVGAGAIGNSFQGRSVSISADGDIAIVGGTRDNASAGATWEFTRTFSGWYQEGVKFVGTGAVGGLPAEQGVSVSLSGDGNTAIVGGWLDNNGAGAAWVFSREYAYTYNLSKNNINKAILDNQNTFDTLTVFTTNPLIGFVSDVNLHLDTINHPNLSDLEISLIHLGVTDTVVYQVGGSGDNFIGTVLNDSASTPIENGSAPFTGSYRPTRPLAQFNLLDVGGSWVLSIYDGATGDTGTLMAWGLTIGVMAPTSVDSTPHDIPADLQLMQNYPNPFNPTTTIVYKVASRQSVRLSVYDILGGEVATLINEQMSPGSYSVQFDGKNLASGVYFYRLSTTNFVQTKKLVLLR